MRAARSHAPRPEILAPAGNADMLRAAVLSGADAVYLGLTGYNARRSAGNFTPEELSRAAAFCHARGVRVHVTLNTLVFGPELPGLADAVRAVAEAGADAVIADDLAVAALVKKIAPELALHGSTQMSIHTPEGARQLAAMGYDRVILARELSLDEIRAVAAASPIEVEAFVHGAMCMAVSGQCMMSAFLGGRSGNRGACAGPCRLPFDAAPTVGALRPGQPGQAYHLSLKDMDLVPYLRELAAAGVASVKIEGRLRTPEYAAAAVAACRAARAGEPYDEALLRDIFSRSGFTDGYLTGRNDKNMFGVRTEQDAAATRAAAPRARELYRRELARVPVDFEVSVPAGSGGRIRLQATDPEGRTAAAISRGAAQPAQRDQRESIARSLAKTGGTPFAPGALQLPDEVCTQFLPGSEWNELRRQVLEALLAARSAPAPKAVHPYTLPAFAARPAGGTPALAARFERAGQLAALPGTLTGRLAWLAVPVGEAAQVPAALRPRTLLELPRVQFGANEEKAAAALAACEGSGFAGVVLNNLAQFRFATSLPRYGGLGLNVTNPLAADEYRRLGLAGLLAHPETPLAAMRLIAPGVPTAALCYGHIPLMLTRACPLKNVRDCANCPRSGALRDRKGRDFPVRCSAPGGAGVRTVYNPVPLYMGDRLRELPADTAVAAFTLETPERICQILALLLEGRAFDGEFTRGLYYT